jgi:hypothetical protein
MKRRGSGNLSSRLARAEIFGFSCSNMSPSPCAARAAARTHGEALPGSHWR